RFHAYVLGNDQVGPVVFAFADEDLHIPSHEANPDPLSGDFPPLDNHERNIVFTLFAGRIPGNGAVYRINPERRGTIAIFVAGAIVQIKLTRIIGGRVLVAHDLKVAVGERYYQFKRKAIAVRVISAGVMEKGYAGTSPVDRGDQQDRGVVTIHERIDDKLRLDIKTCIHGVIHVQHALIPV